MSWSCPAYGIDDILPPLELPMVELPFLEPLGEFTRGAIEKTGRVGRPRGAMEGARGALA